MLFLPCSNTTFLYCVWSDFNFSLCSESLEFSLSSGVLDFSISELTSLKLFSILESSVSALFKDVFQLFVRLSFSPYFSLDCSKAPFNVEIFSFCLSICSFKTLLFEAREEVEVLFLPNSAVTLLISLASTFKSELIPEIACLYAFSPSSFIVPPNVFEPDISSPLLSLVTIHQYFDEWLFLL